MTAPVQLDRGHERSQPARSQPGRLRVLQLVHSDDRGGVEALAEMIGDGLARHDIHAETHFLYPGAGATRMQKLAGMARAVRRILRERPDAVVAYQSTASVLAGLAGRLAGVKTRIVHQTAMPEGVHPFVRRLDRLAGAAGLYTVNVVNSRACAAEYDAYPHRYRVALSMIPHGIAPLAASRSATQVRQAQGVPAGARLIATAGRLSHQKAHERILHALPLLPDTHLVIAGGGPRAAELEALAQRLGVAARVAFAGPVPRGEVASIVAAADAFVFPSRWETFGLAPVEAAMAGVPLVVSDIPVLREVLLSAEGSPVRFVDTADAACLARDIGAVLGSQAARDSARAFAETIVERYRPEPMIEAYVKLLAGGGVRP